MRTETSGNRACRSVHPVTVAMVRLAGGSILRPWLAGAACLIAATGATWPTVPARADESQQPQATSLEQMPDAEKRVLLQKKRRFDELSEDEQARLRDIHNQLAQDPHQAQLWQVLTRYHDWLRMLTPSERAEILSLPPDKRLDKIKELTRTQDEKRYRMMASGFKMSSRDLSVIHDWFDKFLDQHADEILDTLPHEMFGELEKDYNPSKDRVFLGRLYSQSMSPDLPHPTLEEEQQLQALVSKEAQKVLSQASPQERSRIIRWWIGAAVLSRLRINPSLEELHKFAQESLSEQDRSRLENLPADQMYRELRFLFNQRRFGGDPGRAFPWGPPPGNRGPGPGGGPGFGGPPPPGGPGFPPPGPPPGSEQDESGKGQVPAPGDSTPPLDTAKTPAGSGK